MRSLTSGVVFAVDWSLFRDEFILFAALVAAILLELGRPRNAKSVSGWIMLLGSLAALAFALVSPLPDASLWGGVWTVDPLARFFKALFLAAMSLSVMASLKFMGSEPLKSEFYMIMGASTLGMMLLASAGDLILIYVALELTSISLYILASLILARTTSQEAGLKYLLVGAFSTALFLFGASFVYAMSGTTLLSGIQAAAMTADQSPLIVAGLVLILAGLGFKVAAVPFHMWAPDVYEGGPAPMVAFASVASKAAGFAIMARLLLGALRIYQAEWALLVSVLAVLTMVLGSFAAIPQTNVRRLLAYSSIAQAGYILVGFLAGSQKGMAAMLFYLLVYLFTNLGAFITVIVFSRHQGDDEISSYAGLARRSPLLALAFMLSLLSLAGIPPLGGFTAKVYVFMAAMEQGGKYLWLVITGVVLSIVSLYYYLLVIRQMYIENPRQTDRIPVGFAEGTALVICTAGVLLLGIWPAGAVGLALEIAGKFLSI